MLFDSVQIQGFHCIVNCSSLSRTIQCILHQLQHFVYMHHAIKASSFKGSVVYIRSIQWLLVGSPNSPLVFGRALDGESG